MRRYHNRIKWEMFNYLDRSLPKTENRTLLSIGTGKGGDVSKWISSGFTHVICVEPNDDNRKELERRLVQVNDKLQYKILATVGQDIDYIIEQVRNFSPDGWVESINYMLSLSFFFDEKKSVESIVKLVQNTVKIGGYLSIFTIDGRSVNSFFDKNENYTEKDNIKHGNFKMIDFNKISDKKIYVNIPNTIVENQTEYITDIPFLDTLLKNTDNLTLEKITEKIANKETFMTDEELAYSSLFTTIVYKRI